MLSLKNYFQNALQLFYPHHCTGCGSDLLATNDLLCLHCFANLPHTKYENIPGNITEQIFYGRIKLESAFSQFYFTKHQLVQHLIHQLKYRGNTAIGQYLGAMMGSAMLQSNRFKDVDYLLPLPLHASKEFKRGYNQAEVLCRGIEKTSGIKLLVNAVVRKKITATQTKKHRVERWQNVEDSFDVPGSKQLEGRHVLLVDDVVTTGATLEACAAVLQNIAGIRISIATLAIAAK